MQKGKDKTTEESIQHLLFINQKKIIKNRHINIGYIINISI